MGAKHVNEVVKLLLVLRAVDFGKIIYCSEEFLVQPGSVGHSVAVCNETSDITRVKRVHKGCTELAECLENTLIPFLIFLPVVHAGHALTREGELVILGFFHRVFSQFRMSAGEHE